MMIIGAGNDNDQLKGVYFSQRVSVYTIGGSGLEFGVEDMSSGRSPRRQLARIEQFSGLSWR